MYNAGDFNLTETVHIPINTFDSNDPTASVTVTNLAVGDIEIHKDGSITQRASDNGVTVSIDFDGITGNHMIHIDLSDNTDAGFYANGSRYLVRIEGTTVDGGTINAWVGGFSIGCVLRPSVAGRTLGIESDGDLTKVNTLDGHTPQTSDHTANIASILADTNELQTDDTPGALAAIDAKIDTINGNVDDIVVKLPSKTYLTGTNNADGDAEADEFTGEVPATISSAAITEIAGLISTESLETAVGPIITSKFLAFG